MCCCVASTTNSPAVAISTTGANISVSYVVVKTSVMLSIAVVLSSVAGVPSFAHPVTFSLFSTMVVFFLGVLCLSDGSVVGRWGRTHADGR